LKRIFICTIFLPAAEKMGKFYFLNLKKKKKKKVSYYDECQGKLWTFRYFRFDI